MPIEAWVLARVADKVFDYASEKGQNIIEKWVRDRLGLELRKQAYKRALEKAYKKFEKKYPEWAANLFNASFLENEGADVLAQFLVQDGHPNPSDLASLWADSLNLSKPERRTNLVRELEPAATDFLDYMASALKGEESLSELNDSRALDQIASELKALRKKFEAEQATPGTRRDYLLWLIERNLYLDPRGTFQTQRQMQVKLDEVYITLRAQHETTPSTVDRSLLEKEMAQLDAKITRSRFSVEDIKDQREHLMARLESRSLETKFIPGEILELSEAVKRHDRVVILGDPGSGKSTLLRYLALKHAQALWDGRNNAGSDLGPARFPILIRIADYAEHGIPQGKSLSDFLTDYHRMHECPRSGLTDLLVSELATGNCLVLLDGLDEIVSADDRRKVVEHIEDFVRYHGNYPNRFIIASRRAGYRSAQLGNPFVHYVVQDMTEAQIRRFLEHWCTAIEAVQTPDLSQAARDIVAKREINAILKAVQNSPGVHRLATNPLLLRTLALIHRTGAQLPQKRIELYKLAADTLARIWRTAQGVPESALIEDKYLTRLLGRLAYWMHENKSTGIVTEQEVFEVLGQEYARIKGLDWDEDNPDIDREVKKFLRIVREQTGLFVERAPKQYGFMHLTFEEYYAARHLIARGRERAKLIRKHLHKPRWEEPILLALGFVGLDSPDDAAELFEIAIMAEGEGAAELGFTPSQYEDLLGRDFLFALLCLGDTIPIRPKLIQSLIKRMADELLYRQGSTRFERYREVLEERFKYLEDTEEQSILLSLIIKALDDKNYKVRQNAAASLRPLVQIPQVLKALMTTLDHDNNSKVRRAAARSLMEMEDPPEEVTIAILKALGKGELRSLGLEMEAFLLKIKKISTEILNILRSIALYSDIPMVRDEAARLFGYSAKRSSRAARMFGYSAKRSSEVVSSMISALEDNNAQVRLQAAYILGCSGCASNEVVMALINALNDPDLEVRDRAIASLGMLDKATSSDTKDKVIRAIIDTLNDSQISSRETAVWSLGRLSYDSLERRSALIKALQDNDPRIRRQAVDSMEGLKMVPPEAKTILLTTLRSDVKSSKERFEAAVFLGKLGMSSHEVKATLATALKSNVADTLRFEAAMLLGQLGQISPEVIITLLTTSQKNVDSRMPDQLDDFLESLEKVSPEVLSALIKTLHSNIDAQARLKVAILLGQLGQRSPEVEVTLINGLHQTKYPSVRRDAARILGRIGQGDETTIEALWLGLLDSYSAVRYECALALANLGRKFSSATQEIEVKLVQAIQDPKFEKADSDNKRAAYEYAYDGLWFLIVGGEIKRREEISY